MKWSKLEWFANIMYDGTNVLYNVSMIEECGKNLYR